MSSTVTDVIVARARQDDSLQPMMYWSAAGHVVLLALLMFWPGGAQTDETENVMTINLGGAPGPRTEGLTQIGARAVQTQATTAPARPVETPPAPVAPKMTLPDPRSKPRTQPRPDRAPSESTARTPSAGAEPTDGNARVETGVKRGQGFGLSSAGGGGGPIQLDVTDFCCQEYLAQMHSLITRAWDQNQGVVGSTGVKFTIARDGTIQMPQVEKPSGFIALDNSALRALQVTKLPPLPAAFLNPTLTIHLRFDYQR